GMLAVLGTAVQQAAAAALTEPAATTYPSLLAPCNTTLQACINGTAAGITIHIAPGSYITSVTLNKAVSLIGVGSTSTIIRALSNQRIITVTGATITQSTVISGLTFAGGNALGTTCPTGCGGAMLITGSAQPLLQNLVISNSNSRLEGGGLNAQVGSPLTLNNVTVISNASGVVSGTLASGGGIFAG